MATLPRLISLWENNPDTPLDSSNLSKVIDYQSDSKFIYYTDGSSDYTKWADVILSGDINEADPQDYENIIVYSNDTHEAKTGELKDDGTYRWKSLVSPYKKLLKINAKTKIAMNYINSLTSEVEYLSFDVGNEEKVFSIEHIITSATDFLPSSEYEIYLYKHISYGDYAEIKIALKSADPTWKTGIVDLVSPSGYKVVALRKIGGFKTTSGSFIDESTLWDISTYQKEIASETYKIYTSSGVRKLRSEDIPIVDSEGIFAAVEVEAALRESKILLNQVRDDSYTVNRFGTGLTFSVYKKDSGNNLVDTGANELTLKIRKGYIDIFGSRVTFANDIFLASPGVSIKVNNNIFATDITLGDENLGKVYEGVWRVFINKLGHIILKENSVTALSHSYRYIFSELKGWYDISEGSRCIGKFKVRKTAGQQYYIEKLSVIDTFDQNVPLNTIFTFHGTMCPDGLLPCDGRWYDVNNIDSSNYSYMPALSLWQSGSWYEETPNLLDRGMKMPSTTTLNLDIFNLNQDRTVHQGGSTDCGVEGGNAVHGHNYDHTHTPGTLVVEAAGNADGSHTHEIDSTEFLGEAAPTTQVQDATSGFYVPARDHTHNMLVGGGTHGHDSFSGAVENLINTSTGDTSSWAPYKEVLFCIKKV